MDKKFIKVYDNILSKELCSRLRSVFEDVNSDKEEFDDDYKKFSQLTLDYNNTIQHELFNQVASIALNQYPIYIRDCKVAKYQLPEKIGIEGIRIKKYYDSTCAFDPHVDVLDKDSSKRFISFLFYLNDVNEGGETVFFDDNPLIVHPKEGRLVMFPPLWTYPHQGNPVFSGVKYIMSTYLNFV